jgi:hypothetical protein
VGKFPQRKWCAHIRRNGRLGGGSSAKYKRTSELARHQDSILRSIICGIIRGSISRGIS